MGNESQVSVVKNALDAETKVEKIGSELHHLQTSSFKEEPIEPKYEKVARTYPEVKSTLKYWPIILWSYGGLAVFLILMWIILKEYAAIFGLLICALPIVLIVYYFKVFKKKKEAQIEQIKQSEDYLKQVRELDKKYDEEDNNTYLKYVQEKKHYDEVLLPNYQREKAEWEENRNRNIAEIKQQLESTKKELNELYATSKLIPGQYHTIPALTYLYDLMSTSQFDIKEAIEKYDKDEARKWDQQHKLELEKAANEQAEAAWQTAESTERARRDQNRANLVGMYQRHKTNDILRDYLKK